MKTSIKFLILIIALSAVLIFSSCAKGNTKKATSSLASISTSETLSSFKEQIQNKTGKEQLKAIFDLLDTNTHQIYADEKDSNYTYAISAFENFLKTPESEKMTASDFKELSSNLNVFKVADGRVIMFVPDPSIYGLINAGVCAYYQTSVNSSIKVFPLYEYSTKHIEYVVEISKDFIVTAGIDKYVNPYFAFADGFSISDQKATFTPVLKDYKNSSWTITASNGWIRGNVGNRATNIRAATNSSLVVLGPSSKQLTLKYQADTKKYIPQD